jgi:CRISPR/Cas system CMR subunit Cmr4 (Cas7 group RAMP superfamily)
MARGCHGRSKKAVSKNWNETAEDRRTRRDLAEKAKTHKGLYSSEISPTRCNNCVFILCNGFTLHVSGDNLTHHQEYISICTPDDG